MCSLDGAAGVPLEDKPVAMCTLDGPAGALLEGEQITMCPPDGTAGVHATQINVEMPIGGETEVGCPGYLPTSGERDPVTGYVCDKQIKYDMSDFLGSCVRLCKDIANSHDEPWRPACTPFLEEIGDDYGLGGGVCDETPDDKHGTDAWMDIERSGFRSYGYDYDDVKDCHASMYGNLSERTYRIVRTERRAWFRRNLHAPLVWDESLCRL
jgi:hypothetical protein